MVFWAILAGAALLAVYDRALPRWMPRWAVVLRLWAVGLAATAALILLVLTRPGLWGLLMGTFAALPLWIVLLPTVSDMTLRRPATLAGGMAVLALVATGLAASNLGTLLHGDAHPAMTLAMTLMGAALLALVLPAPALAAKAPDTTRRRIRTAAITLIPLTYLVWFAAGLAIDAAARRVLPADALCLVAPDGRQAPSALRLAPHHVLFNTEYRGTTAAWLLAGTPGTGWTHHLSLRAAAFLPNETQAFTAMRPPGKPLPERPSCRD